MQNRLSIEKPAVFVKLLTTVSIDVNIADIALVKLIVGPSSPLRAQIKAAVIRAVFNAVVYRPALSLSYRRKRAMDFSMH